MKVLVIGATGILGRPAVRRLLADGHEVSGFARAGRESAVRDTGASPVAGDLFDVESLASALRGHEAVLNLATRIPAASAAMRRAGWAENDRLRLDGTRALAAAVSLVDSVKTVVQEGISFVYADGGDTPLDEDAPLAPVGVTASSPRGHENIAKLESTGRSAIRLRIGVLVGDDALTKSQLAAARYGTPLIIGRRNDWTCAIHPSDAATAAVAALRAPSGVYNVGAEPIRKQVLGEAMAAAAGVRKPHALPRRLADRIPMMAVLARSQRVVSTRLTDATGWKPELPTPGPAWFEPTAP
ncbi:NAD-dependent epimerase/dehydratase family protein [Amycolatopsis sp. cg5]|uniref:NAD-dependent epimerase/dehydratase family protein n=1 Tax=Amycolatopsis sp. cg5 TaxID=3238802 RepID=UPI00352635EF